MSFQIDSDIPLPAPRVKYPWGEVKIGESFFVPGKSPGDLSGPKTQWERRYKVKFACRSFIKNGVKGTRIWRTK